MSIYDDDEEFDLSDRKWSSFEIYFLGMATGILLAMFILL